MAVFATNEHLITGFLGLLTPIRDLAILQQGSVSKCGCATSEAPYSKEGSQPPKHSPRYHATSVRSAMMPKSSPSQMTRCDIPTKKGSRPRTVVRPDKLHELTLRWESLPRHIVASLQGLNTNTCAYNKRRCVATQQPISPRPPATSFSLAE